MKKEVLIIFLVLVAYLFISSCATQSNTIKETSGKNLENAVVTKIIDGDTVVIEGGYHVRLLGIDTPEKNKPYYQEAKDYLESRVYLQEVLIEKENQDKDQYGRLLRWVWLNDSLINLEIAQKGFGVARFYDDSKYKQEIVDAEKMAMQNKLGLWGEGEKVNINNNTSKTQVSTSDDCVALGCPSETNYVASKNSQVYHSCSCSYAKRIKQENILCFNSAQDAEARGFTKASCG